MAKPSTSLLKRRLDIAEIVRKNGEIKVDDLAEMLAVSGVTIRNDLNYLEQQGYLKRSFGGAIYTAQQGTAAVVRESPAAGMDKALEKEIAHQLAVMAEASEALYLDAGTIMRKVISFLADNDARQLIFNDLRHVAYAREFYTGEAIVLGGKLAAMGETTEGDSVIAALRHHAPDMALIAVDHIAEDGTLSVRNEHQARLLSAAFIHCRRVIAAIPRRPVYGELRFAVGQLKQLVAVVTPQIVAAEYHARLQQCGLINSYTNNECLTWLNPALSGIK